MTLTEAHAIASAHARKLVSKWEKTGLLDRINDDSIPNKDSMCVLLESQAKQILTEELTEEDRLFYEAMQVIEKARGQR